LRLDGGLVVLLATRENERETTQEKGPNPEGRRLHVETPMKKTRRADTEIPIPHRLPTTIDGGPIPPLAPPKPDATLLKKVVAGEPLESSLARRPDIHTMSVAHCHVLSIEKTGNPSQQENHNFGYLLMH